MHIDGAWGGSAAFSVAYPELMKGASRADSITWDAHKCALLGLGWAGLIFSR